MQLNLWIKGDKMVKHIPNTDHKAFVISRGHKKQFTMSWPQHTIETISQGHYIIIVVAHDYKNTPLKRKSWPLIKDIKLQYLFIIQKLMSIKNETKYHY